MLSKYERQILSKICKTNFSYTYRRQLWLRASGASAVKSLKENKNYYQRLKNLKVSYPNPSFTQIELDLKRTFSELKVSQSERLVKKLRNVLQCYIKRNPTIGYC